MSLYSPTTNQIGTGKHVVKFGASWCVPCKVLDPMFEEIAEKNTHQDIGFWSVKIDEDEANIAGTFAIKGVPIVIFLDGGRVVDMLVKEQTTKDKIIEKIEELEQRES